ncbi:MAG: transcription termination/antitermination protein NusA, partial [Bdellovibrio sp.]|nr:transcription termination/antitermination protein NusA [Bdellovibrio sp.]
LAAKLTTWKLDIISETSAASRTAESIFNLMLIPGMNETMAQNIFQSGFGSFQSVANSPVEELMTIPGYDDPEKAEKLANEAKALVAKYEAEGLAIPSAPVAAKDSKPNVSAKAQADMLLKQELKKLDAQEADEN